MQYKNDANRIEYTRWGKVVVKAQLIIASVVCFIEILNNILLYVTRSQGYGPDTIVSKLIRYLFITTAINFGLVIISYIVESKSTKENSKQYILMLFTILICTDVAYSHYQFAVTLAIFVIPIMISILYEDRRLTFFTFSISVIGDILAILARANDSGYNKDIGPEAAIAISLPASVLVFAIIIINTLEKRRNELRDAVVEVEKASATEEKLKLSLNMLETLAGTIDAKDKYTNGHSFRVATYSTRLATALGWDEKRVSMLRYEAMLHDIGKIGVPDSILNKPSRLTDVEFGLIKAHSVIGSDILKSMIALPGASVVARSHHERYDGKGYPDGIAGEDISINARIVCIADSYDAMSSDRIYRKALEKDIIRKELIKGRGTQFDPELLDKFVELFDNNKLYIQEYISISDDDNEKQIILDDIKTVLYRFSDISTKSNAMNDFDKFYLYMRNIGLRYNRSVEVLQVVMEKTDSSDVSVSESDASDILEIAIRKNIRAVDMYYKFSDLKHMIILLDAGLDNIDIIKKRILFDYNENVISAAYTLLFSINDYMEAPKE